MTKEEILQAFDDINFVYNDCTKYDTLKRMLEELTEDVVEVKHGEWIEEEAGYFADSLYTAYCSNCNHYVNWFEDKYGEAIIRVLPNYCSNCGADMRKILPKD